MKILIVFLLLQMFGILNCFNNEAGKSKRIIDNKEPIFKEEKFIELRQCFDIDLNNTSEYFIKMVQWMDIDLDSNLYVLDGEDCKIDVFNKYGKYMGKFGSKGFGPNELAKPEHFYIYNDKLFLYERFRGIKIWDKRGNYLDFISVKDVGTLAMYNIYEKYILGLKMNVSLSNPNKREWDISTYSYNLECQKRILSLKVDYFNDIQFNPQYIIAKSTNNYLYFPEKRDEYIINKVDIDGQYIISFGRYYQRKEYSDAFKNYYYKAIEIAGKERYPNLPIYPPIVRYILIDDKNYIWVVVGEWDGDSNGEVACESTVDIFNENGEFIYSFEANYVGWNSIIKYNRMYSAIKDGNNYSLFAFNIKYKY